MRSRSSRRAFVSSSLAVFAGTSAIGDERDPRGADKDPAPGYLIIYRPGPAFLQGKPLGEQPLQEHGRYMVELHRKGVLRMAGGFTDNSGGAAFIDAGSLEAAREVAEADPAVRAKTFVYELHRWQLVPWARIKQR